ncbi:MAG TPA: ammonia-forming cytochrome c nitrite reductase subunit c552 [Polyangiales bacterium]|nr:ammonia-forming cytochrome c nitrite reductase subunit c552 [Polyangiales bacterium]
MLFERARASVVGVVSSIALVALLSLDARHAASLKQAVQLHTPAQVHSDGYVSSAECRSCHPSEYASWQHSYHHSMTQLATPASVIGAFDGVTVKADGLEYRLEQRDGHYFATAASPGASPQPITMLTGSHYMQIYWFETGEGRRLGQLPFVYLNADRRWVPRNAIFIEPPHALQAGATGRWNASCIACHTTFGQPRIDKSGTFDTRVAELGIACEACHGPGESHVQHNRSPLERYRHHLGDRHARDIVQPHQLSHERSSLVCGQCHGTWLHDGPRGMRRWNEHGFAYRPGGDPAETMLLMRPSVASSDDRVASVLAHEPELALGQFWSDGEVRVSGREFNGMVDSPCYARGELTCLSCHRMHEAASDPRAPAAWADTQLEQRMDGDAACLQCHQGLASNHTHHAPSSDGSRCYNCHMPFTSYGLLKSMRSHRISVPDVGASVDTGRPNACNLCHLDKSLGWTAHWLQQFYGRKQPPLDDEQRDVASALWLGLTGDAGQRALIAWALGWQPAQRASKLQSASALLGTLMDDPYDAVRYIAARSLEQRSGHAPQFDWLQRPDQRAPIALEGPQLSAPEQHTIERLHLLRNDRPLHLLE